MTKKLDIFVSTNEDYSYDMFKDRIPIQFHTGSLVYSYYILLYIDTLTVTVILPRSFADFDRNI